MKYLPSKLLKKIQLFICSTKKAPEGANFNNGGNDEARLGFPPRSEISAIKPHGLVAPFLRYPD